MRAGQPTAHTARKCMHARTHTHTQKPGRHWQKHTPHALLVKTNICSLIPAVRTRPTPTFMNISYKGFFKLLHTCTKKTKTVPNLNLNCCCLVNKQHAHWGKWRLLAPSVSHWEDKWVSHVKLKHENKALFSHCSIFTLEAVAYLEL